MRQFAKLAIVILVLCASIATADGQTLPQTGLSMLGTPKYPAGFDHFDYVNPDAPKGGVLRYAVDGTFDTLNPHVVKGVPAAGSSLVFETLLARSWDEPFSLYPLIASSVEMPADRAAITFHLDPRARWHDGTPITVDDVLFSFEALRTYGTPNRRQYYNRVTLAERIGDDGVRFTFSADPDGHIDRELPLIMGLMPIHQKKGWANGGFDRTTLTPPMGSGPYRVAEVDPGRRIVYERVTNYWGVDLPARKGRNNFDRIIFDYYRDDAVALEAFKAGEADIRSESDPVKWATAYQGPALAKGQIVLRTFPNHRPAAARGLIFNERRAIFRDQRVRHALGLVLDYDWINRVYFHDTMARTRSYYPNSELAATGLPQGAELAALQSVRTVLSPDLFTTTLPQPDPEPRVARRQAFQLLDAAGWHLDHERLVNAQGRPFTFEILLGDGADERIAMEFVRAVARLGITATLRTVDSAQFQRRLDDFDFDMTLRGWVSTLSPGNEQLYYFGTAAADQPGSRNYPGIKDPAVDALAGALGRVTTREELVGTVRALDRVLLAGDHMIPLFHDPVDRIAASSRLRWPDATPLYGVDPEAWWDGATP